MPPPSTCHPSPRCSSYATWYIRRTAYRVSRGCDRTTEAEDIRQELTRHLLSQWPQYDPGRGKPTTFIQNVVNTRACELIRDRRRPKRDGRSLRSLECVGEAAEHGLLDGVRGQPEVSDQERTTLRIDCETVLSRLPSELRRIAELLQSKRPSEVARQLDLSESALRRRLVQLREHFVAAGYHGAPHGPEPRCHAAGDSALSSAEVTPGL